MIENKLFYQETILSIIIENHGNNHANGIIVHCSVANLFERCYL